jgi:hypothetical protein
VKGGCALKPYGTLCSVFFDPHVRSMTVLRFAGDEANATPSGAEISAAGTPP